MHCGVMSKHCECLWLLNVIMICNVLYLCECTLNEIYCAPTFSLGLNESMISFHAFFFLFKRMIGFYPFRTLCQSVMDYALKLYTYAWNSMVSGFFYANVNNCNAVGKNGIFLHLMRNTRNTLLAYCNVLEYKRIIHYKYLKS